MRAAAGMTFLMDGLFVLALQDISLQLIKQRLAIFSSPSPPLLFLLSLPLCTRLLSIWSFHLVLSASFFSSSLSHPDFPRRDSNQQLSDNCSAVRVNIALVFFHIFLIFFIIFVLLFLFCCVLCFTNILL